MQSAGTDFGKIWSPANLQEQIWKKYSATQSARTDLEIKWSYAGFTYGKKMEQTRNW